MNRPPHESSSTAHPKEPAREDIRNARQLVRTLLDHSDLDDRTLVIAVDDLVRIDARLHRAVETIDYVRAAASGIGDPVAGPDNRFNRTRDLYTLILEIL